MKFRGSIAAIFALSFMVIASACSDQGEEINDPDNNGDPLSWNDDVYPEIGNSCSICHTGSTANGDFDITNYNSWISSNSNMDNPYVVPGEADSSELVWRLEGSNDMPVMPPPPSSQLTTDKIDLVKRWIDEGANP